MRTKLSKALKQVAIGGTLAAIATSGYAATQGTVGFNSTGDLIITMNVTDDVRISALEDLDFGTLSGVGGTETSPACIYRNSGTTSRLYEVSAVGSGLGGAYTLTGITGATVPYSVTFNDTTAGGASTAMSIGGTAPGTNARGDINCATFGNNASIDVTISDAAAQAAPADAYTGTLTLTVSPN